MKFRIINTFEELEVIRTCWEQWQDRPNNDFAQFKMLCQLRAEVESVCVIVIEINNQPRALLAGRVENRQFVPSVGYMTPLKISAKVMTLIHQGVLGEMDQEIAKETVSQLWSLLRSGVADAIEFNNLPEDSPLLEALQHYGSGIFYEGNSRWSIHRQMTIPAEGEFLKSKVGSKQRWKIRKRQQEIETAFPNKIRWCWISQVDDVPRLCARLEETAAHTYQRALGVGFVDDEEQRRRVALFSSQGQFRAQTLEIDGKIEAFWIGVVCRNIFYSSATGYNQALSAYEIGTLVFVHMVDELAREGVHKLDFGGGDAVYKQRFGDRSWRESTVCLFAPTGKGLFLRSIRSLFFAIDLLGRSMIERMGLLDRLKTGWRRRLKPIKSIVVSK